MIIEIILGLIVGLFGLWFFAFWKDYRHLKKIPAPKVWPFIGNAAALGSTSEILENLDTLFKKYNSKTIRFHAGFDNFMITKDYKMFEFILSSQTMLSKGFGYKFLHTWLGHGLLTSDGQKWKSHRKMITPTFHFKILEQFIDVFNSKCNIMIEKLEEEVNNKSVDIYPYVTLCALDIICETAMGTSVNAQSAKTSTYVNAVKAMNSLIEQRLRNIIYQIDFWYRFTQLYQQEKRNLKILHDYTNTVISKRRDQLTSIQSSIQTDDDVGQRKKTAFLDMLLQATVNGVPLTDQEIREEVDTFMFEGHDTTAAGVSYALFCLANNPEVQQRVFEELFVIFGDNVERECTYQDLQDMKYLDQVIKETMRVYPPVPLFERKMTQDVEFDNMILPKDLTISILIYAMHKDPDYYPDPEKFDPDRWGPQTSAGKHPYAFIPFSAGMRNCIGQKYAMLEMKASVSKVIRNFELKPAVPAHKIELAAETVLKAVNGIRIGIEKRKY